MTPIELVLL
jgi:hypothetical protein